MAGMAKEVAGSCFFLWLFNIQLDFDGLFKEFFAKPRPVGETFTVATGYSFPSGHAMLSLAYYGYLALVMLQKCPDKWRPAVKSGAVLLILVIGFSRIYLNVHYTSDVLAGYVFGSLVLSANWWLMRIIEKRAG